AGDGVPGTRRGRGECAGEGVSGGSEPAILSSNTSRRCIREHNRLGFVVGASRGGVIRLRVAAGVASVAGVPSPSGRPRPALAGAAVTPSRSGRPRPALAGAAGVRSSPGRPYVALRARLGATRGGSPGIF